MQNRLFHKPTFHHDFRRLKKKASWLELFYDLIYVAAFIQLGNTFAGNISLDSFVSTIILFLSFWVSWSGFTYFSNRYTLDDVPHRLTIFLHMFCIGAMAVTLPDVFKGHLFGFTVLYGVSQFILAALYLRAYIQEEVGRPYTAYWGLSFLISALVWMLSIFLPPDLMYYGWFAGSLVILMSPMSKKARSINELFPFDHEHLAERYGLLTIIVLGESFVKVLTELVTLNSGLSLIMQSSFTLLLTCSIWWIYFDDVAESHLKDSKFAMPVWLVSHMPLQLAIVLIGIGLKTAILSDFSSPLPMKYAMILTFSLGTTLLATGIIDTVTQRKESMVTNNIRVNLRLLSGVLYILIGVTSQSINNLTLLSLCLFIALFQILIDTFFSPYHINEEDLELEAKLLSEGTNISQNGSKNSLLKLEPIRKGLPSDLKKDLYYFFIESSWPVIFITIFFVYIISNVFFAMLYVIATSSDLAQAMSMQDAFFFSVQTMSTIGYGVLAPQGVYSNLLVTIEAAFGIIGVALVTGVVFHKISKPNSKILFSDKIICSNFDGVKCLSFRIGNARGNDILEMKMNLSVVIDETTKEGSHIRRVKDLKLKRNTTPFFKLTWSIFHPIDEDSPLYGIDLKSNIIQSILVTTTGHDGTYSDTIYARYSYAASEIEEDRYFEDIMHTLPDGRIMIDYDKFHKLKS